MSGYDVNVRHAQKRLPERMNEFIEEALKQITCRLSKLQFWGTEKVSHAVRGHNWLTSQVLPVTSRILIVRLLHGDYGQYFIDKQGPQAQQQLLQERLFRGTAVFELLS